MGGKKKRVIILIVLLLAVQAGCGEAVDDDNTPQAVQPTENAEAAEANTKIPSGGTLRVAVVFYNDRNSHMLKEAIDIFNEKFPLWEVVVEAEGELTEINFEGNISYELDEKAMNRYFTDMDDWIKNGEAADVIAIDLTNKERLMRENLLEDLMPLILSDDSFDLDTILPGVLRAMNYTQGLYYMPLAFWFPSLYVDEALYDERLGSTDDLTEFMSQELPELWNWENAAGFFMPQMARLGVEYLLPMTPQAFVDNLIKNDYSYFYDEEKEKFDFDNVVFRDMMLTAYNFHKRGLLWNVEEAPGMEFDRDVGMADLLFSLQAAYGLKIFPNAQGRLFPLPQFQGAEGISIYLRHSYAINVNAREKTAAWEFIKILCSAEVQNKITEGQPILSTLSGEGIRHAFAMPEDMPLSEEEIYNYNSERQRLFSHINREHSYQKMSYIGNYMQQQMNKFFADELTLDRVIANLNNYRPF